MFLDPTQIQKKILENLKATHGNIGLSTPLANLTEASVNIAAIGTNMVALNHKKRFITNARTIEDLYPHLSDRTVNNLFVVPSNGDFTFLFDKNYIKNKAVKVSGTNYRRLLFPKYSIVSVADIEFTLPVAVEFLVLNNGSIRLQYDVNDENELVNITNNSIPWYNVTVENQEFIQFSLNLLQTKRRVIKEQVSPNKIFKTSIDIEDGFHHCNVFTYINGNRIKLLTTYTDEVKNINKATAIVKPLDNKVEITIPQIYNNKKLIGTDIEIELFVSKGDFTIDLKNYKVESYSLKFGDYFKTPEDRSYFNPLNDIVAMSLYSDNVIRGGVNAPTFEELYDLVLYSKNPDEEPINQNQLSSIYNRNGYNLTLEKDNILSRLFVASKTLPKDELNEFNTGMSCGITSINTSIRKIISDIDTVKDNDKRITLLPNTLFDMKGTPSIVPNNRLPTVLSSDNTELANILNEGNYAFIPFHYVIDTSEDKLDLRPYNLKPVIKAREVKGINQKTEYSISTLETSIELTDEGYVIYLQTMLSDTIDHDRLFTQLSFLPVENQNLVYLPGELVSIDGNIALFKYVLATNFDIDRYDSLYLSRFHVFNGDTVRVRTTLNQTFNLTYGLYDADNYITSNIDNFMNPNLISGMPLTTTYETLTIKFGDYLSTLWNKSRNISGSLEYERYEYDVPYLYQNNQFKFINGKMQFENVDGKPRPILEHRKGDPVMVNGEPDIRFKKGSVKRDPNTNEPILKSPNRSTDRSLDFFVMDANYLYSKASTDIDYKNKIIDFIVDICEKDMKRLVPDLGENTIIQYFPTNSAGNIRVIDKESVVRTISSSLSFKVKVFMNKKSHSSDSIRDSLNVQIPKIIAENLDSRTVSISLIEKSIKDSYGEDIISVEITTNLDENLRIFTVTNNSDILTIRRKLDLLEDSSMYVKDDIEIIPILHNET